jgi:hypothetical protein
MVYLKEVFSDKLFCCLIQQFKANEFKGDYFLYIISQTYSQRLSVAFSFQRRNSQTYLVIAETKNVEPA